MIHRIRIQNFRSLGDVNVHLSPVTVFIGLSGTGKTNFATAVRLLRDYLRSGAQGSLQQQHAANKCATNPSGAVEFEVEFDVPGFPERFLYELRLDEHIQNVPRSESLVYGNRTVFRQTRGEGAHQGARWQTAPALVTPPQPGPVALGLLPGIEEAVVAYTALTAGIGVYAFPYNVLGRSAGAGKESGLADDGANFVDVLKDIANNLQNMRTRKGIVATLRRVNSTVAGVELDSLQNPTTAVIAHRLGDKVLPLRLDQESDGFRRFYAHLLALYQSPPKQTLIFEEPENGIYPGALSLLADEFKAAPEAGRGQVILTTHSPALLDSFSADQIRVVELSNLETRIGPLAEEQRESLAEELLHTGELLTVDPARREGE